MFKLRTIFGALIFSSCVLAACASGGIRGTPLAAGGPKVAASGKTQAAVVTIVIPKKKSATKHLRPAYVSASSLSVAVTVNGSPPPTVANLVESNPQCTMAPNGDLSCGVAVDAPTGTDTFLFQIYDALNAQGNLLSTVNVPETVTDTTTTLTFTLDGVVKSASIVPVNLPAGTATSVPLTIVAVDADQNTIIAPGNFADAQDNPITYNVSYSDPTGHTTLSNAVCSDRAWANRGDHKL